MENSAREKLKTPYDAGSTEARIYTRWMESGYFNPDNLPARHRDPFTIIMPPPNANGRLHAGHALTIALEDIMIRYHRMRGSKALWVPGADHAGFETQVVYEKKLEKEGRSRFKMERKELYDEIMAFTLENKKFMEDDVRTMGASCDWSREKFTLDADIVSKVQETFRRLYRDKLAYRGFRTVNWCTKHQTTLSDVETETTARKDTLYHIQYGPFIIATVRPETIFGDTAIAVHPDDPRYARFIGTTVAIRHPEKTLELPVIGDTAVDMEFGTGALKITPAHDHNDFAIAERHGLPRIETIDRYGKLTAQAGKYAGMKIAEARTRVAEDLREMGLLVKTEEYEHAVPSCYKCGTIIEPRVLPQWFVHMKPLAEHAAAAVRDGHIRFVPENFEKVFLYWMDNAIDWNISRQIVWGIPIPALVCVACNTGTLDTDAAVNGPCPSCGAPLSQDTDTFDTWFSSGQWPLLALDYPDTPDFKTFYPSAVMETGRDLIFRWIPRMVIFGLYLTGKVPFHTVYLHGMVNDKHGKKMSKSKGNVVSPVELSQKYGADALRIALVIGNTAGTDLALSEDKIKGYKHFINKVWNIARFVTEHTTDADDTPPSETSPETPREREWMRELDERTRETTEHMEHYRFHLAGETLYHYVWHQFADRILEESKAVLRDGTTEEKAACRRALRAILSRSLILLHPFIPFATEEIWGIIKERTKEDLLLVQPWP